MKGLLLLLLGAAVLILAACASDPSESLCDAEEGQCIGVHFDGETCAVSIPPDAVIGDYTLVFANESEIPARVEIGWLDE
jgi:hypothetical protein